jgi:sugar phosphate isomerase/epimerase
MTLAQTREAKMIRFNRRAIMFGGAVSAALVGLSVPEQLLAQPSSFFTRKRLPLGIQLYTLGPDAEKNLDGTLKAVAAIGYRKVELAGLLGRTPAEMRAALDRAKLSCTSAHVPAKGGGFTFEADPGKLAEDLHTIGVETAVMPMMNIPERFGKPTAQDFLEYLKRVAAGMTADDWRANADFLNRNGHALNSAGIRVGYHNHNLEFAPLGSTNGLEILIANTDPSLVTFEVDIGWVAAAGVDPLAFIAKHKGRVSLMHVKDLKVGTKPNYSFAMDPAEIGSGSLDWKRLLPAAYEAGVRGFYVEQEPPFTRPRIEAAKISYDFLSTVRA